MKYNFINPKKPTYNKGYLIIESDDNNIGDYTHWLPRVKYHNQKHSQFINSKVVKLGFNINSKMLGKSGKVSQNNLIEMYESGLIEILAHNRHHVGIGRIILTQSANIGDTIIHVNTTGNTGFQHNQAAGYMYKYKIYNETDEEIVTMTSYSSNTITLSKPLAKSFSQGSYFAISDESRTELVEGCISDLEELGFEVKNYTFTYHAGSSYNFNQDAIDYISNLFDSARGRYGNTNELDNIEWSNLNAMAIRTATKLSEIDVQLDLTANNNLLLIAFGHGESDDNVMKCLDYLIEGAMSRGIRIISRQQARELFKDNHAT